MKHQTLPARELFGHLAFQFDPWPSLLISQKASGREGHCSRILLHYPFASVGLEGQRARALGSSSNAHGPWWWQAERGGLLENVPGLSDWLVSVMALFHLLGATWLNTSLSFFLPPSLYPLGERGGFPPPGLRLWLHGRGDLSRHGHHSNQRLSHPASLHEATRSLWRSRVPHIFFSIALLCGQCSIYVSRTMMEWRCLLVCNWFWKWTRIVRFEGGMLW